MMLLQVYWPASRGRMVAVQLDLGALFTAAGLTDDHPKVQALLLHATSSLICIKQPLHAAFALRTLDESLSTGLSGDSQRLCPGLHVAADQSCLKLPLILKLACKAAQCDRSTWSSQQDRSL